MSYTVSLIEQRNRLVAEVQRWRNLAIAAVGTLAIFMLVALAVLL
jgi:hypothetical protein